MPRVVAQAKKKKLEWLNAFVLPSHGFTVAQGSFRFPMMPNQSCYTANFTFRHVSQWQRGSAVFPIVLLSPSKSLEFGPTD